MQFVYCLNVNRMDMITNNLDINLGVGESGCDLFHSGLLSYKVLRETEEICVISHNAQLPEDRILSPPR